MLERLDGVDGESFLATTSVAGTDALSQWKNHSFYKGSKDRL
jgi:hypothetical protein